MKYLIILATLLSSLSHKAQEDWTVYKKHKKKDVKAIQHNQDTIKKLNYDLPDGNITINQDSEIDSLTYQISKAPFINGYTVQIEVSQQQSVIKDSRHKFLHKYPDVPLDEDWIAPNKYLYAGRFYDRNSAFEFKHTISGYFPNAIVIQKKMELPPLPKK